ncbi:hypothetical protein A8L34_00020 [Bacillus sp. FJAT-27264]|uniref:hypothetical protein n=1 Tax=Paenibacillus sp. (strain DSM 101736 / FJAT-27264) TaxID=1850362 RepID=UPI000807CEE4|nr:hypothetical protein [Bacillus sp. FJAT-27264]OBZ19495.1 hypothetical protein A8L34_00020 [Bacillus sp. FJAT-27264]
MSQANIPNITPTISLTIDQTVALLLGSIALEELALAHIINAEAEKIQYVLGTLGPGLTPPATLSNLLTIDASVRKTLQEVVRKEVLLQQKLEGVLSLVPTTTPIP